MFNVVFNIFGNDDKHKIRRKNNIKKLLKHENMNKKLSI